MITQTAVFENEMNKEVKKRKWMKITDEKGYWISAQI